MVDYTPLWKTIHEREITQHAMLQDKVLDKHTLDSLKRNMNITLITLERICKYPDFSYNGMGFRLQLPFRIFLCGYRKLFSINRTVYNNISFTHLLR